VPQTRAAEQELAEWLVVAHPEQAARLIETGDEAETAALLGAMLPEAAIAVMRRITADRGARVLVALSDDVRRKVLASLNHSRSAAILARLAPEERELCLKDLDDTLVGDLRALLEYPPETAGALMDPRVTSFRPDATTRDVIRRLQRLRNRRVQDVFVVDEEGRLVGSIPLETIVLAEKSAHLTTLAEGTPVSVKAIASRTEIIETFETHRVGSLPVVDLDGRLLGVLRQRELIQAAQERATASAVTMVGASEEERALSSPWFAIRKRLPWLEVNLVTAFLAAAVVGFFEHTIASVTALAVLLPVVAGQSGNTGAQALAVTMRGLALREVRTRDWLRVATKELIAGAGNGVAVALTTSVAVYFWSRSAGLAGVIGVSMVISMALAGFSGAAIPMLLTALRQDPAQSSSIVLTTVTDVAGFFSFLGIATLLMAYL
jgi:magnesium transporter